MFISELVKVSNDYFVPQKLGFEVLALIVVVVVVVVGVFARRDRCNGLFTTRAWLDQMQTNNNNNKSCEGAFFMRLQTSASRSRPTGRRRKGARGMGGWREKVGVGVGEFWSLTNK